MKLFAFVLKNLRRSPLRTFLTSIALVVLVVLFSVIWSILAFLQEAMAQKAADIPVVITERYRIPSRFDRAFMEEIVRPGAKTNVALSEIKGFHAEKHNVWHFIVFSVDKELKNKDEQFFVIATYPEKIKSMVDSMESLDPDDQVMLDDRFARANRQSRSSRPRCGPTTACAARGARW